MFSVILIERILRKSPIRVLKSFRRNMLRKKDSGFGDPFAKVEAPIANFEKFQRNLTPQGYEVIYLTPVYRYLMFVYKGLPLSWALICFDIYNFFTNEEYKKRVETSILGRISVKDKVMQIGLVFFLICVLHFTAARVVVSIYRKGNEYKTMTYGVLGPLTRKFVHHGPQAMGQTEHKIIYNLKGRKIFLFSNGFQSFEEFASVVKL